MADQEHQTSVFMNNNNDASGELTSGNRLLSTTGDDKHSTIPRTRMTRPSRVSGHAIIIVLFIIAVAVAIIIIVALTTAKPPTFVGDGSSAAALLPEHHVRCENEIVVGDAEDHWLSYSSVSPQWKEFPLVEELEYVLISRQYELKAGSPGIQVSVLLPYNNSEVKVLAVTSPKRHTRPVTMTVLSGTCQTAVLDDKSFFSGNGTRFRIYVFYENPVTTEGAKFAVTSLPHAVTFKDMHYRSKVTSTPEFSKLKVGERDICSVEIYESSKVHCQWWNVEDGDNAEFKKLNTHECITSGVQSSKTATWFFSMTADNPDVDARALMISPIIERKTPSILLTLWYMIKCYGPHLRIHLVPANQPLYRILGVSKSVVDVTSIPSHSAWKFLSFQIMLPETHDAYQIVFEGIVPTASKCDNHMCFHGGITSTNAKTPMLVIDDITIELMHEQCNITAGPNVMDCKFQNGEESTTCEWTSSSPDDSINDQFGALYEYEFNFADWKPVNSGDDNDHGATEQHFEGRGHVMTFDASGRTSGQSYVRSPYLKAGSECSCTMRFIYLLRGILAPRLQVNLVYDDPENGERLEPQWSLFGHQSEKWESATIAINLRREEKFKIEIRVLDITDSQGDIHFDDMSFFKCDMEKFEE